MPMRIDPALIEMYGEPVSIYTQAQAIEDGTLIQIPRPESRAYYPVPVLFTAGVWGAVESEHKHRDTPSADVIARILGHSKRDYIHHSPQRREFSPEIDGEHVQCFAEITADDEGEPCVVIGEPMDF